MDIQSRMTQLACFGIAIEARPLREEERTFSGDIVARFSDGAGVEYLPFAEHNGRKQVKREIAQCIEKEDGLFKILAEEIGQRALQAFQHGILMSGAMIAVERHVVLDFAARMHYQFNLPARVYWDRAVDPSKPYALLK